MTRRSLLLAALLATAPAAIAYAQASDPGAATVESFDGALLDSMKQAKSLGVGGRYQKLEPAVGQAFDLPTMTRFAVGPDQPGAVHGEADGQVLDGHGRRL